MMDEFTPESLRSFIGQPRTGQRPPPQVSLQAPTDNSSSGKTARARRIDEVLRSTNPRQTMAENQQSATTEGTMSDPDILDARARAALGEMVQYFTQHGMHQELQHTLTEHRKFIDNMLQLLQKEGQ